MNDFMLNLKPTSTDTRIDHDVKASGVRVYKSSPETAVLQIWAVGPTNANHSGKHRATFSSAHLTVADIDKILAELSKARDKLIAGE